MDRPEWEATGKFVQAYLPKELYLEFSKLALEMGKTRQELLLESVEAKIEKERRHEE